VQIFSNQVVCSADAPRGRKDYAAVELMNCEKIRIDGLDVKDRSSQQTAVVKIGADCPVQGITVTNIITDVAETCITVLDLRAK
jgi:hypothetical protein